jgi:hypothetical protein
MPLVIHAATPTKQDRGSSAPHPGGAGSGEISNRVNYFI